MRFDSIIIGGGVAGLSGAIRCAEAGLKTAVIAAGQSALHFSSGSIDVLGQLPDGSAVSHPFQAFDALQQQSPDHPYSLLGKDTVSEALNWYQSMMAGCGIQLQAQPDQANHLRLTPMGTFRPTWLSQQTVHPFPLADMARGLSRIALITLEGFRDFQPQLAADNLRRLTAFENVEIHTAAIALPGFDTMLRNPCEFRSIEIARVFKDTAKLHAFAKALIQHAGQADLVVLPAIFGNGDGAATLKLLEGLTGFRICELPTMPPSLLGIRLEEAMKTHFQSLGGLLLKGDEVTGGDIEHGRLQRIYTKHHQDMPLTARQFLIASGSFFSRGLAADRNQIQEPVFGLDMANIPARTHWYQREFFSDNSHPYLHMGISCNRHLQPAINGQTINNLYGAGALLAHYDPVREGCGSGVAISSGYFAAEQMIAAIQANSDTAPEPSEQKKRVFL